MKIRKQRKRTQKHIRRNNSWSWWFDKFIRRVADAYAPLNKALEQAYAKARNERQLQQA